jgi:very-short-patch-repair endonuclease
MKENEFPRLEISPLLRKKMVEAAREFRKSPTISEEILWQELRGRKLCGIKFRRQQPIGPFVVDFYAPVQRLVVEIDGEIHEKQRTADQARQELLEEIGLRVIRISADLVESDLQAAIKKIEEAIL